MLDLAYVLFGVLLFLLCWALVKGCERLWILWITFLVLLFRCYCLFTCSTRCWSRSVS